MSTESEGPRDKQDLSTDNILGQHSGYCQMKQYTEAQSVGSDGCTVKDPMAPSSNEYNFLPLFKLRFITEPI